MKLVYIKTLKPVELGDLVENFRGAKGIVKHFVPPHKPSSTGHISVKVATDGPGEGEAYNYVGVWGMEWIDREDRR